MSHKQLIRNGAIWIGALLLCLSGASEEAGLVLEVNPGKEDAFQTLEEARDHIRSLRADGGLPDGGILVEVAAGDHFLTQPFRLSAEDSGTAAAPVHYVALGKRGETRLSGGVQVERFEPVVDEPALSRLSDVAREHVLQADLKALGIEDYGELSARGMGRPLHEAQMELFYGGKPMQLARYPNEGWMTIEGAGDGETWFTYGDEHMNRWAKTDDVWLHGYWTWDWADSYVEVAGIHVEEKRIQTKEPHGVYGYKEGQRFYALNILEELDAPGEYYIDRDRGMLYFYPPDGDKEANAYVSVAPALVVMEGVEHVSFENFVMEHCTGTAVTITDCRQIEVQACTIRNTGNRAVTIDGGAGNRVADCEIHATGDGGVYMNGGDRQTLAPGGHEVKNTHIHDYSRWVRTYRPAVQVAGVGNRIAHCLIHDAPHSGLQLSGNEHVIEYNELHSVCQETGDVGAFYMGRDWTMRGNIIRHNYLHDIHGPYTHGAMAVYLDDAASGQVISGNVFEDASRAAFIGGGRDNLVENNLFIDCEPAVHIDARCLTWAKDYAAPGGEWRMYAKLDTVDHDAPPYSERYPELAAILDNKPAHPLGNVVRRNVSIGGRWLNLQNVEEEWVTFEANFPDAGPALVDQETFQLQPDSAPLDAGFKQIPFDKIGLLPD